MRGGYLDAQVASVKLAGSAPQLRMNGSDQVGNDQRMPRRTARHCDNSPITEFAPVIGLRLTNEIFVFRLHGRMYGRFHTRIVS